MQRIGMILKRSDPRAESLGEQMNRFLEECGKEVLLEPSCSDLATDWKARVTDEIGREANLLIVLGGDGTMLRAAALLNGTASIPVLGINLGRVGFMAEASPEEAIPELLAALSGTAVFSERMLLQVTLPDGKTARVLNDLVIHWANIARVIDLGLKLGTSSELEVRADGLIIATPVGSSAYSYAAGGPLVHPDVQGMLMTPICPYAGLKHPVLIPPYMETEITLKRGDLFRLTLDGHTVIPLKLGQSIKVVKSPVPFVMVKTKFKNYFDVLKKKLSIA